MRDADFIFEIAYEVCNKVGGIYTVIKSKSFYMKENYGEKYYTIGPYNPKHARIEFDEQSPPAEIKKTFGELEKQKIKCHYGIWLIPGRPKTILLDTTKFMSRANELKKKLWKCCGVDSLKADDIFNESTVWSIAVGMLLEKLMTSRIFKGKKCVAHFHEWLAGGGLVYLNYKKVDIATVFTTHATTLGRTLAGSGVDLYKIITEGHDGDNVLRLAKRYGVQAKHTMEVACAKYCDTFTTVSQVTAMEAKFILDRDPDVLLLNGLDSDKYPGVEELTILRRKNRIQTRDFLTSYFSRYYDIDYYNLRSIFISGRYEFRNKGLDIFIDALGKLNKQMKKEKIKTTAVVFIWIPNEIRGENFQVLKNKALYEEMHDHIAEAVPDIEDKIMLSLTKGEVPKDILSDEFLQKCRKLAVHFRSHMGENPPICAFELANPEEKDKIMKALKKNGLLNRKEDKVKVIYYPAYLSAADRLISLDYNQATMTCDVGVFPSYYEPWGYTPLETAAQGSLAITTDLAGFGKFIEGKGPGIYVLKRIGRGFNEMVNDLKKELYDIVTLSRDELTKRRQNAKELSMLADWKELIKNYILAHDLAVEKRTA